MSVRKDEKDNTEGSIAMNYILCNECECRIEVGEAAYHWNDHFYCTTECVTDAMEEARTIEQFTITEEDVNP